MEYFCRRVSWARLKSEWNAPNTGGGSLRVSVHQVLPPRMLDISIRRGKPRMLLHAAKPMAAALYLGGTCSRCESSTPVRLPRLARRPDLADEQDFVQPILLAASICSGFPARIKSGR